mmetsp:Transcript_7838/g.28995  ORF Transcript_7838/g.28995 Transcript_7838/m.28995 type:complete len:86 (-) Transcript_7838:192-449(-)
MPASARGDTVMLSLVVEGPPPDSTAVTPELGASTLVDLWFQYVSAASVGSVTVEREPFVDPGLGINAFIVRDPAGYLVEVLRFLS